MKLRRVLGVFAALAIMLVVAAAPAAADPTYPPKPAKESCVAGVTAPGCPAAGRVTVQNPRPPVQLAETGYDVVPIVAAGVALTLLGGLLLLVRRRRAATTPAA